MAVPIHFAANAQTVDIGAPKPLFPAHVPGGAVNVQRQHYVVFPDGQRFLLNSLVEQSGPSRITVILNLKSKS